MIKSIKLSTEEVRKILDENRHHVIILPTSNRLEYYKFLSAWDPLIKSQEFFSKYPPYTKGDTLYVKETWVEHPKSYNKYLYLADKLTSREQSDVLNYDSVKWKSSVRMPKVASRIWLKVTDIQCERLQNIPVEYMISELPGNNLGKGVASVSSFATVDAFGRYWDSQIASSRLADVGWRANPCVYIVDFKITNAVNFDNTSTSEVKLPTASLSTEDKAILLMKRLRESAYNHTYYGTNIAVDVDTAVSLVEEIFGVDEPCSYHMIEKIGGN